jgi:hypothetical protein
LRVIIFLLSVFSAIKAFPQYFISEVKRESLLYVHGSNTKLDVKKILEINNTSVYDSASGTLIERNSSDTNYYLFSADTVKYYTSNIDSSQLLYKWVFYSDGKINYSVKYGIDRRLSSTNIYNYDGTRLISIQTMRGDTISSFIEYLYKKNSLIGFNVYRSNGFLDYTNSLHRKYGLYKIEILQKGESKCVTSYKSKKKKKMLSYNVSNSCNTIEIKFQVSEARIIMESAWENGVHQYSKSYFYNDYGLIDKIIIYKAGKIISTTSYVYSR